MDLLLKVTVLLRGKTMVGKIYLSSCIYPMSIIISTKQANELEYPPLNS